jgi:hypothetical protein
MMIWGGNVYCKEKRNPQLAGWLANLLTWLGWIFIIYEGHSSRSNQWEFGVMGMREMKREKEKRTKEPESQPFSTSKARPSSMRAQTPRESDSQTKKEDISRAISILLLLFHPQVKHDHSKKKVCVSVWDRYCYFFSRVRFSPHDILLTPLYHFTKDSHPARAGRGAQEESLEERKGRTLRLFNNGQQLDRRIECVLGQVQ